MIMHHIVHCIDCVSFCVPQQCMHHIVAYCHVLIMFGVSFVVGSASEDNPEYPSEGQYPRPLCQASKTPLFIPIQSHSLTPALFYCIRTTTFQLFLVAVVEAIPLPDLSSPQ